ncbi:MAG: transposase [Acidobacteria bacterium]|nr:transposase [Acidobacteriota bacterium]
MDRSLKEISKKYQMPTPILCEKHQMGYPLDSGSPKALWFGLSIDTSTLHPECTLGRETPVWRRLGYEAAFRADQRSRTRHGHRRLRNVVLSASLSGGRQWPTTVSCGHLSQMDTPVNTADPKHLGAQIGFLSVLHTWGQNLLHHPHVHCVIPSGGLSPDHKVWVRPRYRFFLPVKVLSRIFRGKFVAGLKRAYRKNELCLPGDLQPLAQDKAFRSFLRSLFRQDWVVYAKPPFGGPLHVFHYLARYTHRVAISNHHLLAFTEGKVTFRWKDYARGGKQGLMTLTAEEFLRRFLLHILPRGFVRIRFYGFLAPRRRGALLPLCQQLLKPNTASGARSSAPAKACPPAAWSCPLCGGPMMLIERLTAQQIHGKSEAQRGFIDTS